MYWFDDAPTGACRAPAKWELQALINDEWVSVSNASGYGTEINQYNETAFEPVTTTALRLTVRLQRDFSAGILEWKLVEHK